MNADFITLFLLGSVYLIILFAIAYAAEQRVLADWLNRHPATYVLSLGVFVSAYGIYGVVDQAQDAGYSYMNYYLGTATAFIVYPLLIAPLMRICQSYRLGSLADLLTFRFRSQVAGSVVTLFMLVAMLPLMTLQIQAVSESMQVLSGRPENLADSRQQRDLLAFLFCVVIIVFAILFGSRHLNSRESHRGLVTAIAFESVVKLVALSLTGIFSVIYVFGSFENMQSWLAGQEDLISALNQPAGGDTTRMALVMFFASAVCLPHVFHLVFAENPNARNLRIASWAVPLYLLLISLPVFPILWAGEAQGTGAPAQYYSLIIGKESGHNWLSYVTFIGGLSAASGVIIVATLALANMSLNHLILPLYQPDNKVDIYHWLLRTRQLLIAVIIAAGFLFYFATPDSNTLSQLAIAAVSGCVQFFPGALAILYWPHANSYGFISGLAAGFAVWALGSLATLVDLVDSSLLLSFYVGSLPEESNWVAVVALSLTANALVFIAVSLLTNTRDEERIAAEVCTLDDLNRPVRQILDLRDAAEMQQRLAYALGDNVAHREVARALEELQLNPDERRPYALRRLRDRIEINLSALMGPGVAKSLVDQQLPYASDPSASSEDITFIESRLELYNAHLTGLAADLNNLRRYHRQTLDELPIGLCSLGSDGEILMWNRAMSDISGIASDDITGSRLTDLADDWQTLLQEFQASSDLHWRKHTLETDQHARILNLHKAAVDPLARSEQVIIVEDVTDTHLMENKLTHQERLASIGRLAAGVAHEIGNPVTGIACLAQNLLYDSEEPEVLESADQIIKQTQRITGIVQSLVNFAHQGRDNQSTQIEAVDIRHCINEAIQLLSLDREATQVEFSNRCPNGALAAAETQRLIQVLINLLANARDASDPGGVIVVDAEPVTPTPEQAADTIAPSAIKLSVCDNGSGIPAHALEKIFEPFFTTKEPGKGTGLGLALVYNIIEDLNGDISIESPVADTGRGTCVHITLPAYQTGGASPV
ncbi:PAS domain S-box-containing protein [Litorivivens lipolytica]|uniref:histidine kinase n=1 Tax=Litorivivens lipolytica TaxID=1524264 RepID=A0A7W4Z663_9GAMM|nr:ATP-binding protein [Litorivivens lipolytica]MBB3046606.1 PAS domain S-box-containing protein [Litorivivens lipolytica]